MQHIYFANGVDIYCGYNYFLVSDRNSQSISRNEVWLVCGTSSTRLLIISSSLKNKKEMSFNQLFSI